MKSARRHSSLIPLSREHHYALLLCLRIRRGAARHGEDLGWLRAKAADVARFFESDLRLHFKAEEEVLFPAMKEFSGAEELISELVVEHRRMEELIGQLQEADHEWLCRRLNEFADLLETHIRQEERRLFPLYEREVTPELASTVARGVTSLIGDAAQPRHPELLL
jgi:hemerythrin-like domain-containing protein